jgi:hypothetical protein
MKKEAMMLCICLLAAISLNANAKEDISCFMQKIEAVHSSKDKRTVTSYHNILIINEDSAKTYHIDHRNQFMSGNFWVDNNRKQYDVTLQHAQDHAEFFALSNELIFSKAQQFETQAVTTISVNGKILKQCINKNVALIY